jgi:hypothetical protein
MSCSETFPKQPSEVMDIEFDFSRFFAGSSDFLSTAVVAISGDDAALVTGGGGHGAVEFSGTPLHTALVWLQGGTTGVRYKVEVQFTTDEGRVKEEDFFVQMFD